MTDDYQYAPLDFSSIMGEKFAVHCQTEEDARHFCAEIKRQFGKAFKYEGETWWGTYRECTAYSPYLDKPKYPMTYCEISYYLRKRYTIVPFDDLKIPPELGEIEVEELDFNTLFG